MKKNLKKKQYKTISPHATITNLKKIVKRQFARFFMRHAFEKLNNNRRSTTYTHSSKTKQKNNIERVIQIESKKYSYYTGRMTVFQNV